MTYFVEPTASTTLLTIPPHHPEMKQERKRRSDVQDRAISRPHLIYTLSHENIRNPQKKRFPSLAKSNLKRLIPMNLSFWLFF